MTVGLYVRSPHCLHLIRSGHPYLAAIVRGASAASGPTSACPFALLVPVLHINYVLPVDQSSPLPNSFMIWASVRIPFSRVSGSPPTAPAWDMFTVLHARLKQSPSTSFGRSFWTYSPPQSRTQSGPKRSRGSNPLAAVAARSREHRNYRSGRWRLLAPTSHWW